jgi:hypothetical protein
MPLRSTSAKVDNPSDESGGDADEVPAVYPTVDGGVEINSGSYRQSAAIKCAGITRPPDGPIPSVGDTVGVSINDEEVAVAEVEETGRDGQNRATLTCFTRERQLFQTSITDNYTDAPPADVLADAFGAADVPMISEEPYPFAGDFGEIFDAGGEIIAAALEEARQSEEISVTADYSNVRAIDVIKSVTRQAGWEWKIERGRAWFGHPGLANLVANDPDNEAPDDLAEELGDAATPQTWSLRWVLSDGTSPQDQAAAFDIIRVVGPPRRTETNGVVVEQTTPIVAEIDVAAEGERPFDGVPRVHIFESDRIRDQSQANNIAREMWNVVNRRRSTGQITVAGDTRLRPLDSCRMLPELSRSDPADFYRIKSVYHQIDSSEGFTTEITVEGYGDDQPPDVRENPTEPATVVNSNQNPEETNA